MNLTPKQIQALRIAVADMDGWKDVICAMRLLGTPPEGFSSTHDPAIWSPEDGSCLYELPNYPENLDAVHEVVSGLPDQSRHAYAVTLAGELWKPARTRGWQDYRDTLAVSEATALQRCIALLRALSPDKWEEIQNLKD